MTDRIMFKATLSDYHEVTTAVVMSKNAEVLHATQQDGAPRLWYINDETDEQVERRFVTIWTGRKFNVDGLTHVGTAVGEHLVSHIFEVTP